MKEKCVVPQTQRKNKQILRSKITNLASSLNHPNFNDFKLSFCFLPSTKLISKSMLTCVSSMLMGVNRNLEWGPHHIRVET